MTVEEAGKKRLNFCTIKYTFVPFNLEVIPAYGDHEYINTEKKMNIYDVISIVP